MKIDFRNRFNNFLKTFVKVLRSVYANAYFLND